MSRLAIVSVVVKAAVNAEKVTRGALHFAELYASFQVYSGALECPTQIFDVSVPSLETRQVQSDPFANVFDTLINKLIKINTKTGHPFNIWNLLTSMLLVPLSSQNSQNLFMCFALCHRSSEGE